MASNPHRRSWHPGAPNSHRPPPAIINVIIRLRIFNIFICPNVFSTALCCRGRQYCPPSLCSIGCCGKGAHKQERRVGASPVCAGSRFSDLQSLPTCRDAREICWRKIRSAMRILVRFLFLRGQLANIHDFLSNALTTMRPPQRPCCSRKRIPRRLLLR